MSKQFSLSSIVLLVALSFCASAAAATITFNGAATVTGGLDTGTSAQFADLAISCTAHSIVARATALSGASPNTSLAIAASDNVYREGGTRSCRSIAGFVTVSAACAWSLTAESLTRGRLTIPADCLLISFDSGVWAGCVFRSQNQSQPVTLTAGPPLSVDIRTTFLFTANALCPVRSGNMIWTERLTFPGMSLSNP
jgi:hypothetical protein